MATFSEKPRFGDPDVEAAIRVPVMESFLKVKDKYGKFRTFSPRIWVVSRLTQLALRGLFTGVNKTNVEGMEHLNAFLENPDYKKKVIIGRHQADADHPIYRQCLEEAGRGEVADSLTFPAGVKMWTRFWIAAFMRAENCFPIPTSHEVEGTDKWLETHPNEDPNKLKRVRKYHELQSRMTRAGLASAGNVWKKGGALVVYPEGGRTYDEGGYIGWALDNVAAYIDGKDRLVLPTALSSNVQTAFPVGRIWRPFRYPEITLKIGRPFVGDSVSRVDRSLSLDEHHFANRGTALMVMIAELDPSMVRPDQREFYQKVRESLEPVKRP